MGGYGGHIGMDYDFGGIEGQVNELIDAFFERVHDVVDVVDVVGEEFDQLVVILCIQ